MSYMTTGHPDWPHDREPDDRCTICDTPYDEVLLTWYRGDHVCDKCLSDLIELDLQMEALDDII